jgi:hypothetical protein
MIVYRHIRLDTNEPFYIGIGVSEKRAYSKNSRNRFWRSIVRKTDYKVDILIEDLSWEEACEKEKEFISLYGRRNLGTGVLCNLTDGGEGRTGCKHTEEAKKQMSIYRTGRKLKPHTDEAKYKMSLAGKGRKQSEEAIKNNKEANRERLSKKIVGVSFHKIRNNWRARINVDGKEIFLGSFDKYEDALQARLNANEFYWGIKNNILING